MSTVGDLSKRLSQIDCTFRFALYFYLPLLYIKTLFQLLFKNMPKVLLLTSADELINMLCWCSDLLEAPPLPHLTTLTPFLELKRRCHINHSYQSFLTCRMNCNDHDKYKVFKTLLHSLLLPKIPGRRLTVKHVCEV